jgi:hypothetical protein
MASTTSLQKGAREGLSYQQLLPLVEMALRADAPVLLRGHPGVGKSALAQELAQRLGLPVLDLRLAQKDPAELAGIYAPNPDRTALQLLPPEWALELRRRPMLLFLDEINAAVTKLHQAAAYQMVLERRVGPVQFHPQTRVMAAGNLDGDRALAMPLSSALLNRFVHFRLRVDAADWLLWAEQQGLHAPVRAYVGAFGRRGADLLYRNTGEDAFATPRSWAQAARLLALAPTKLAPQLLCSCVGPTATEQYLEWQKVAAKVDPLVMLDKGRIPVLDSGPLAEPSLKLAMLFAVADLLNRQEDLPAHWLDNSARLLQTKGVDPDHAVLLLRRLTPAVRLKLEQTASFLPLAKRLVDVQLALLEGDDA